MAKLKTYSLTAVFRREGKIQYEANTYAEKAKTEHLARRELLCRLLAKGWQVKELFRVKDEL